ncbi:Ig-like domain-containing protein [Flavobacterium sp.]|uniref:Ig-like domain-containing protein n=1 Tax=Flavobacterium sp. TaxID=239 RepID=UPI003751B5B3
MLKDSIKYFLILLVITVTSCAKRGTITGGLNDTLAPKLINSMPKNFETNFKGKEIKLFFNEYVKLKNVNKQLIISPPMKRQPEILPYNASKFITVKIKDTLQENTTYSLNFGNSIEDNNEGNALEQFKYVFSTGSYIDSLQLNVKVKDAIDKKVDNFVSIMLYEVNEKYSDSIVYIEAPRYITNTLDSLKIVKLENLKPGKYQLIALKDVNGNNKYDPKTDKIGFQKDFITIPNDTVYEVELFKEENLAFKAINVSQTSGSKLVLGYEGNPKDLKISIKKGLENVDYKISKTEKKDSLNIWFKANKADSIVVNVEKDKFKKQFKLKIKDQRKDSLSFNPSERGDINFRDTIAINSDTPLLKYDISKMKMIRKDSTDVKFTLEYNEFKQKLKIIFEKEPLEKYNFKAFPGAITDFYNRQNDTLDYSFSTRNTSDYGNLRVKLENIKRFPVIVQLTDKEGKVLATGYSEKETLLLFDMVEPNLFTLRLIYDDNKNKVWDAGNFLEKRQSEEVIYFPVSVDVRTNWDVEQSFDGGKR